jgi:hypothetical protein
MPRIIFADMRSKLRLALGMAVFWTLFLLAFGSRHMTLNPTWQDGPSNVFSTWVFFEHGFRIFSEPIGNFASSAPDSVKTEFAKETGLPAANVFLFRHNDVEKPVFFVWNTLSRPYPPGLYLYLSPMAYALEQGWLSFHATMAVIVFVWLFIAHLAFLLIAEGVSELIPSTLTAPATLTTPKTPQAKGGAYRLLDATLTLLLCTMIYFEFMRWTMNSQYELISLLFVVLSIRAYSRERCVPAACWYCAAVFLHFRSLFYLPIFFFAIWRWFKIGKKPLAARVKDLKFTEWTALIVGAAMGLMAFVAFLLNYPTLVDQSIYDLNGAHYSHLGWRNLAKTLPLLLGSLITFGYWFRRRAFLAVTVAAWTTLMFVQTPLTREWYAMFLFPIVLLLPRSPSPAQNRVSSAIGLIYLTYMASVFANNSPFEFRFVRDLAETIARNLN